MEQTTNKRICCRCGMPQQTKENHVIRYEYEGVRGYIHVDCLKKEKAL